MDDFLKLTPIQVALKRELYRRSFYDFVKDFWQEADPQPFVDGALPKFYAEYFQYLCRKWVGYEPVNVNVPKISEDVNVIDVRNEKRNGNINVPPRHSKSKILNVLSGCWIWINAPIKMASISHTQALAGEMNKARQKVINSPRFRFFFPEIQLITNTAFSLKDNRGGELYSINRDAMTGYGADIIVCDDLTNAESARKDQKEMANAIEFYRDTLPSRVNNIDNYIILNIQQRLAVGDVTGFIESDRKLRDSYSFVVLPAQFEKETYIVCPISGDIIHFNKGDFLWVERFGNYEALKIQVGDVVWETQYLQKPIASDKTIIKKSMIVEKFDYEVPSIDNADMVYASHDFPVKDKDTSDFLGSVLAYRVNSTLYITDCLEKRMDFVKSVAYVKGIDEMYQGCIQIIEDKANGTPILQQLQDEVAGMQAFNPATASKMQRLESASLYLNSGNVVFVKGKDGFSEPMQNLVNRLLMFPFVEHDDIIDAFSMLVMFVFLDKKYSVYGRSFNEANVVNEPQETDYNAVFFNREGDLWKAIVAGIRYGNPSKIYVEKDIRFRASIEDAPTMLKKFSPNYNVYIDCTNSSSLDGILPSGCYFEKYEVEDFDNSVSNLITALAKKQILIDSACNTLRADIENYKFSKTKDDTAKYATEHDGAVACLRVALKYFGL